MKNYWEKENQEVHLMFLRGIFFLWISTDDFSMDVPKSTFIKLRAWESFYESNPGRVPNSTPPPTVFFYTNEEIQVECRVTSFYFVSQSLVLSGTRNDGTTFVIGNIAGNLDA